MCRSYRTQRAFGPACGRTRFVDNTVDISRVVGVTFLTDTDFSRRRNVRTGFADRRTVIRLRATVSLNAWRPFATNPSELASPSISANHAERCVGRVSRSRKRAQLEKGVSPHLLRHLYAVSTVVRQRLLDSPLLASFNSHIKLAIPDQPDGK
jgi:integrase